QNYNTPIKTITKLVHGIQLTYKDSSKAGQGVDITVDGVLLTNNVTFSNNTVTLPDFHLNSSGAVTKVTVRPKVTTDP
ncbi:hypothetical protein ACEQ6C_40380, partial [Rhizobium ruizarguesonis]